MKATIKANGTLVVTAENETEEYALKKWSDDNYNPPNHKVNICVELVYTLPKIGPVSKETIEAFTQ